MGSPCPTCGRALHPELVDEDAALEMATALAGPAPVTAGAYRLGDVRHVTASPARAAELLGFRASVPFEQGMVEFATAPLRPAAW